MKRSSLLLIGVCCAVLFELSCKKSNVLKDEEINITNNKPSPPSIITQTRNLNVVYFVPNDLDTLAGYQKRMSDLLLWGQDWIRQEMNRNGYGNKTFGLPNDGSGGVKILTIRGSLPKSKYPYTGGSDAVDKEVKAYFAAHPADKTSDHTLIIIPRYYIDADGKPSGGPFYGYNRWCYALDYEEMDIANLGKTDAVGNRFSGWFGGLMHELGHGLNLRHDRQKVSENSTLGMSLMWAGNGTLGKSPTFITAADAAVLNVNQIFNDNSNTYYEPVTSSIYKIYASYSTPLSSIVVSGRFTSTGNVTSILYINDPNVNNEGTGLNNDYNSIAWESKKIGTDSFKVVMPIADLQEKADGIPYELKVRLVHDNGTVTEKIYLYTFSGGVPVFTFSSKNELSKAGWSIYSFSSEETVGNGSINGRAATLIDGDANTYWSSRWKGSAASYPHNVVIDLGANKTASGLSLLQRTGFLTRGIKNFELLTSTDGINFTSRGNYVAKDVDDTQYFDFTSAQTFRYFKLIANSAQDRLQYASLVELGLY